MAERKVWRCFHCGGESHLLELREAAENIANFAWSAIREVDCPEAADHLNKLLGELRAALAAGLPAETTEPMTPLSSKARALIEAAEKATEGPWDDKAWLAILKLMVEEDCRNNATPQLVLALMDWPPLSFRDDATFIATARNDAPDIAKAYLEAADMLRHLAGVLEREEYTRSAALVRAFLAKHDGGDT